MSTYIINEWISERMLPSPSDYEIDIIMDGQRKFSTPVEFTDLAEVYNQYDDIDIHKLYVITCAETLRHIRHKYLYDQGADEILCAFDYNHRCQLPRYVMPKSKLESLIKNPTILKYYAKQWTL